MQNRRICCENTRCEYIFDENLYGHCALAERLLTSATPPHTISNNDKGNKGVLDLQNYTWSAVFFQPKKPMGQLLIWDVNKITKNGDAPFQVFWFVVNMLLTTCFTICVKLGPNFNIPGLDFSPYNYHLRNIDVRHRGCHHLRHRLCLHLPFLPHEEGQCCLGTAFWSRGKEI